MLQSEPAIMIVRCNRNCLKDHRLKRSEIWGTITESRRFNAMLRVCMGAMRRVNHVKLVKFSIRQYQRSPQGHGSHHLCTLRAVADKQLTEKTRHLEYENRIKMVKHDFQNLKSCNEDNEGLTETSWESKENGARLPGPLKSGKALDQAARLERWKTVMITKRSMH